MSAAHRRTSSWTKTPLLDYRDATTANFVINLYNSFIMKEKRDAFSSLLKQVEIDIFKITFRKLDMLRWVLAVSLEHQVIIARLQVTKVTMQELSQKQISNPSKSDKRHSLDFKQEGQTISLLLHLICLQKRFSGRQ